jgi:hypothetical protein
MWIDLKALLGIKAVQRPQLSGFSDSWHLPATWLYLELGQAREWDPQPQPSPYRAVLELILNKCRTRLPLRTPRVVTNNSESHYRHKSWQSLSEPRGPNEAGIPSHWFAKKPASHQV